MGALDRVRRLVPALVAGAMLFAGCRAAVPHAPAVATPLPPQTVVAPPTETTPFETPSERGVEPKAPETPSTPDSTPPRDEGTPLDPAAERAKTLTVIDAA